MQELFKYVCVLLHTGCMENTVFAFFILISLQYRQFAPRLLDQEFVLVALKKKEVLKTVTFLE